MFVVVARGADLHDFRRNDVCSCRTVEEPEGMKIGAGHRQGRNSAAGGSDLPWVVGRIQSAASGVVEVASEIVWQDNALVGIPKSSESREQSRTMVVHMGQTGDAGEDDDVVVVVVGAAFLEQEQKTGYTMAFHVARRVWNPDPAA